jgi:hypothetical protein
MKLYDVYSYWGNRIGQVWASSPADALDTAKAEYDGDVYVLPAEREVSE